jgi:hypothetical protein
MIMQRNPVSEVISEDLLVVRRIDCEMLDNLQLLLIECYAVSERSQCLPQPQLFFIYRH